MSHRFCPNVALEPRNTVVTLTGNVTVAETLSAEKDSFVSSTHLIIIKYNTDEITPTLFISGRNSLVVIRRTISACCTFKSGG